MVLSDIIDDYQFAYNKLLKCAVYFTKCKDIIDGYFQLTSTASAHFFSGGNTDSTRQSFVNEMSTATTKCFALVTKLNSASYSFYSCLGALTSRQYNSEILVKKIDDLNNIAETVISSMNKIIEEQPDGTRKNNLLPPFIESLQELMRIYHSLKGECLLLDNIEKELMEPLPEGIAEETLSLLEIRSYKKCLDFSTYAQDIALISKFISQIENILQTPTSIYTRKIESGTLKISWAGGSIELGCISEIISAIVSGIRSIVFIPSDIRLKNQELEKMKAETESMNLDNTSRKLAIINSQIDIIADKLNLDKTKPENIENIQRLCIPLIDYLESNPLGSVNGQKYDINNGLKYLTNNSPNTNDI